MSKSPADNYNAFNNFAHDLKNPLGTIKSCIELLESFEETSPHQKSFLARAYRSAERIESMIANLLEYALLGDDYIPEVADCDLEKVLEGVLDACVMIAQKHEVTLTSEIASLPIMRGNSALLHSLFLNLLMNAIKYNRSGGNAKIIAYSDGEIITVEVIDNGIGIPTEEQERIYDSFYRIKRDRGTDTVDGAGLGLSIVQHIITYHSATITVKSEEGVGTTFTVIFPLLGQ